MIRGSRCRGIAAVWILFIFIALTGVVGLACDIAYIHFVGQQLQNAADASALAGGQHVRASTLLLARIHAQYVAASNCAAQAPVQLLLNEQNLPDGQIVIGRYYRVSRAFVPTLQGANAIKVVTSRPDAAGQPLALFFGPIFGTENVQIARQAIAFSFGGGNGAALLVLDPDSPNALRLNGNPILNIPNGSVQVNSVDERAISTPGNPTLNVSDIYIVHDYPDGSSPLGSQTTFDGNLWDGGDGVTYHPDPLVPLQEEMAAYLAAHPLSSLPPLYVPSSGTATIGPGYYPNGIVWNNGDLTLQPGMYIVSGDGLQVTGGNFYAEGVHFYVIGGKKTTVKLTGNGVIQITPSPATAGTPWAGVCIYQDVNTTTGAIINGTDLTHIEGTLYFPSAHLTLSGTGDAYGNQVIAKTVEVSGTSVINILYDGRFPGVPKSFLVE